ncbi:MAG: alpha-2-macroglobulin family protein, partial [Planctomycetota bacterium]
GVAELRDGRAQATLRVPRGVVGSVVVEATRLAPGETSVDRRFLVVRGDGGLRVDVRSDRAQYRPGGRALLSFRVFDAEGRGVPAALSVAGVDAALLALAGPNPGLVQALRAREQTALSRPDSAFDARDLRPADGATRRAQATIASLRFPTMRSTRAQLEELLPASFRESGLLEEVEEMFARNAAPHVQRRRAYFLEALEEQGHASTAAALRRLAQTGVGGPGQWVDQAPLARARAAERRSGLSQWLGLAFMTVSLLAMGWVLARDRGVMAGVGMASVAGASLLAAAVSAAIFDDVDVVGATMWAAVLVAQLGILLARPSRRSSSQIRIFTTFHLLAAFSVFGGEPVLLVPLAILVAVFQLGAESRGAWWVAPMVGTLLFLALGMCTVVLIPKGRERATLAESRNLARVTTQLLAEGERDETGASRPRRASRPPAEVRDDFRESLLFLPELVTDADGRAEVEVPLPDSLARWVVQADAITSDGGLADSEHTFVVTKPLTVDLYLPVAVTEGDLLAVQAVVRNTTDAAREVEVRLDRPEAEPQTVRVEPRGVRSVFWPIRFPKPGRERLTVRIDDDAVARTLQVVPHARPVPFGGARRVEGAGSLSYAVPASARRDVLRGSVRIERGPLAPVLEGLDAMLAEPHGCFEQTSSINYPNIMVLRYLDRHGRTDPALRARALDLLERGAQRLRRFESRGSGGFALYPGDAPSVWLTAYGLMQLRDMASVLDVDGALRERARAYLVRRGDRVRWTGEAAYVVLALGSDAPPAFVARLQSARAAIELEPYLCGLTALALLPHDAAEAKRLAARLRTFVEDDALVTGRTVSWGSGSVEATAVGALALLETGVDPALARRLVRKLVETSRPGGGWGSTHATVFALKALLAADRGGGDEPPRASVTTKDATIALNDETPRVPLPFEPGPATLGVQVESGSAVVRVEGIAYVPWTDPLPASPLTFTIAYETKRARLGQPLRGVATLDGPTGGIDVPMIEWGLPAGFRPVRADLEAHVRKGALRRWEMAGRTLRLYLAPLEDGPRRLPVRFVPSAAGELRSAPSRAYPYYDRAQTAVTAPVRFTVQDRN